MAIPRISFPQFRKLMIDFGARNRAMLDVDQSVRITSEKTDHTLLRVNSDAIAISILVRRRDDRSHWNIPQFPDSLESVTHLSPFDRYLVFVANVLVSASATSSEIRTLWLYAIGRCLLHLNEIRFGELLLLPHDFRGNELIFNRERNKNGLALFARDSFTAESDVLDF